MNRQELADEVERVGKLLAVHAASRARTCSAAE